MLVRNHNRSQTKGLWISFCRTGLAVANKMLEKKKMLDERTDENEHQVFFFVVVVNDILGNSTIGQMDLDIMAHVWNYNCMIWLKKKKKKQPSTFLESKKTLLKSPSMAKGLDYKPFYMYTHKERNVNRVSPLQVKLSSYLSETLKVRPDGDLKSTCIVQLHFKDVETIAQTYHVSCQGSQWYWLS